MNTKTDDDRITFHTKDQIMEVDFSHILFDTAKQVNAFYDLVDAKMAKTGQNKWYFLVNYKDCRIALSAWIPFANRGKRVNIASSLGSARYAVSDETGKNILQQSEKEDFDPNLFTSRQAAIEHLKGLKEQAAQDAKAKKAAEKTVAVSKTARKKPVNNEIRSRISFNTELQILRVDFSDTNFDSIQAVNEFYDAIADRLAESGEKWYFMVNYNGTKIDPDAWYQWAIRSRRLNGEYSLGTVRFNANKGAKKDLMKRADADNSDPNLVSTRDEAIARIIEMRSGK